MKHLIIITKKTPLVLNEDNQLVHTLFQKAFVLMGYLQVVFTTIKIKISIK